MAHATCLNEECDKGTWRLTKHPDEYAGGGPSCPECGTTRIEIEYDEGEASHGQQRERRGGAPARVDDQQRGTGMQTVGQAESAGDAIAQGALALTSDEVSTEKKAGAIQQVGTMLADAGARFFEYNEQQRKIKEERAREVDLQKDPDLPRCAECGHVFKEIGRTDDSIQCPECGEVYQIVE